MLNAKSVLFSIVIAALFSSCASSYKSINPEGLRYPQPENGELFSYSYGALRQSKNRKLAKKEEKSYISIVAVKIVNNTGRTLRYGHNFNIYSDNEAIELVPVTEITKHIKQTVPTYLFYLLLTPMRFNIATEESKSSIPVGLVVGPGLAAINMLKASGANKKFKYELEEYNITHREIKNGETFYGLVGISTIDRAPLTLKLTGN